MCEIRDYAWGDLESIPRLLGVPPTGEPQAEMWMGAHPIAPSRLKASGLDLDRAIAEAPELLLGASLSRHGAALPYLCKLLAAREPLSIQVHPNRGQARAGFEREERLGIALDDPLRTYRDPNHKPELVVALEPFHALCGFRRVDQSLRLIQALELPELSALAAQLDTVGGDAGILASTMKWLLNLSESSVEEMIEPLRASPPDFSFVAPEFSWVPDAIRVYPDDVGVLVGLLLNHVVLQPGQGMLLPAGNVHSYLSGLAIEVMANSDNVVRCGLTKKNVDVEELLSIATFAPSNPPIQSPSGPVFTYETAVSEFALNRIELATSSAEQGCRVAVEGPEILVVTEGEATIEWGEGQSFVLVSGQVVFVSSSEASYRLFGDALVWRVSARA